MRISIITTTLLAAGLSQVAAQYTNQSEPFALYLVSDNESYNGTTLSPCHEGAAIEGLCLSSPITNPNATIYTYNFNTSIYDTSPNTTIGQTGIITYLLRGGNFNLSSPLGLSYNPTSNVAIPLFTPGAVDTAYVAFDENGLLNIQGYQDDTTVPISFATKAYYRWAICETYWGYAYTTLVWVLGESDAQNPTCVKVDVKRSFIKDVTGGRY